MQVEEESAVYKSYSCLLLNKHRTLPVVILFTQYLGLYFPAFKIIHADLQEKVLVSNAEAIS